MKKLLVAAIGAATAFGAFADRISTQRFESEETGEKLVSQLPGGANYWSEGNDATKTNTYTVGAAGSVGTIATPFYNDPPDQALGIKTTFGKPLNVNMVSGGSATNIPSSGIYFDSLVKFTVCDSEPDQTYDGAKIIMWLQTNEAETQTNLYVRAGYLSYNSGDLNPVSATPTNYVCSFGINGATGDFADKWHRVTIKAIPDITTGVGVPGFAIYIDGSGTDLLADVNSTQAKWDNSFNALTLTEGAKWLNDQNCLFPSMVQSGGNKGSLEMASFDGTGSITDIIFTDEPMAFAADYVAPKASIQIGDDVEEYPTLNAAIAALNAVRAEPQPHKTVTFALLKGIGLTEALTAIDNTDENVEVVIDLKGCGITNSVGSTLSINSPVTIIDSSVAKTGEIVMTGKGDDDYAIELGDSGTLELTAGTVVGYMTAAEGAGAIIVSGGTINQDDGYTLAEGKKAVPSSRGEGFYDVVNKVSYTVKFISGEGSLTNEYTEVEGTVQAVPTPAAVEGKSFSAWDPAIAGATVTVTANATYTAQYTNNIYTITFVIGENSTSVQKEYGSEITSVPTPAVVPGYTGSWDDDPTGDIVTGNKTYTYTYSAETYTITFVNEIGTDPAQTQYTIESGTITLPTATTENMGVQFDGWTNATITTAITNFTPTTSNVGSFTLYAAWSSTGSSGYDGGDDGTFTVAPDAEAEVFAATGHALSDTVEGKGMNYAQAYALGLVNEDTGAVADLETTIEIKDGKVVVGLSEEAKAAYTITLNVYEKSSLSDTWPETPTRSIVLGSEEAAAGFEPSSAASGFYKTEVVIRNK